MDPIKYYWTEYFVIGLLFGKHIHNTLHTEQSAKDLLHKWYA